METTLSNIISLDEYKKKKQAKKALETSLAVPSFYYPFVWVPVYFYYNPSFYSQQEEFVTPAKVMNASY
jgi:hypothetical protein